MANIPNTRKPAIFLSEKAESAKLFAIAALYKQLQEGNTKVTVLASQTNKSAEKLKELIPNLEVKTSLPPKRFMLSLSRPEGEVENVQWQQDKDNLNIYITTNKGNFSQKDLKLNVLGADYDLALLPGVKSLDELGEIFSKNKAFFSDTKLYAIGAELNVDENYDQSSTNRPNLTTLAEQVYHAIEPQKISKEVAQLLFAGILFETNNLRKPLASSEVFVTMKKLVDKGAQTQAVSRYDEFK